MSAVGVWVTVIIIFLFTCNNACSISSNFWLAAWADDVNTMKPITKATADNNVTNSSSSGSNDTETDQEPVYDTSQRDMRLGVYAALGLLQCKS